MKPKRVLYLQKSIYEYIILKSALGKYASKINIQNITHDKSKKMISIFMAFSNMSKGGNFFFLPYLTTKKLKRA